MKADEPKWISFTSEYWNGLTSKFQNVNGVFSPLDPKKKIDAVAYLKQTLKGPISAEVVFQIVSSNYANLNVYYDNWFRWELAGNDLRSIKLYKNIDGCTAMKQVVHIDTNSQYLPQRQKLPLNKDIHATFYVYLTQTATLETGIDLKYVDDSGKEVELTGIFRHEFKVALKCDKDTVLNIDNDSSPIGIGLMPVDAADEAQPKVKLEKILLLQLQNR